MDYELFKIIIQQIKEFPEKIKCIGLTGIGEPLLNKRLPDMIQRTKEYDVADKIVVTTNGSLLKQKFSDSLVNAGLDEIIISIEALNDKKYYDITTAKVNFEELVDNIYYLYKNRGKCKVFVKIVNIAFVELNDEKRFHEIFDGISDMAYVEKIIPQFKPVNYDDLNLDYERTLYDKELLPIEVCSMIFYAMQIATSGNVCPCCVDYNETVVFGNVKTDHLYDIWNSRQFNEFRKIHLNNERSNIELCHNCSYLIYNIRKEDILDEDAERVLGRMREGVKT
jgi:radical SAM protein with 4Fe4S-binding SPASM domain